MRVRLERWMPLLALAWSLCPGPVAAEGPTPLGEQFQVNTYTTDFQEAPSIAAAPNGDFLVLWESFGSFGSDDDFTSIQGQRYAADATPIGGQFQVNTYAYFVQSYPAAGFAANGDFVVVWHSYGSVGSDNYDSIEGQRYASDGSSVAGEFQVNSYTTSYQYEPSVGVAPNGDFVVVWHSYGSFGSDDDDYSIQGQRYASDGTTQGGEFQINTYTTSSQSSPSVGVAANGDFVVVWDSAGSYGSDTSGGSVQARRYSSDGTALGNQFQINSYTSGTQRNSQVAVAAGGSFVVVWESTGSYGSDTSDFSVQGQRFASDGTPIDGQFQVNSYTTSSQTYAAVGIAADGQFVVAWESAGSFGSDDDLGSIQGQRFTADGAPAGEEFQVNTYTTGRQEAAAVGVLPPSPGNFVVAWASAGSPGNDDDDFSVQAQLYYGGIFADGFETGDTSRWSTTVP